MSFRVHAGESPEIAVRRLWGERTRHARSRLAAPLGGEAVHAVRRDLKRLRSLLEWVRPRVGRADYHSWRRSLERASGQLADLRDAQVRLQTLSRMPVGARSGISPRSWNRLACRLRSEVSGWLRRWGQGSRSRRLRERLSGLLREFRSKVPPGLDWPMLHAGLRDSYRRARRGLACAQARPGSSTRHRWRRRIQRLSDQMAPLEPAASPAMAAWAAGLETLRARLGLEHDLWLLRKFLRGPGRDVLASGERERLLRVLRVRRRKLAADALRLGRRLFLLPSSRFLPAFQRLGEARRDSLDAVDLTDDTWAGREPTPASPAPGILVEGNGSRLPGPDEPIRRR